MARRVFVAGMAHETTSFSPIPTARASFLEYYRPTDGRYDPPADINLLGYGTFVELARAAGDTVFPSTYCAAMPSAPLNRPDYAALKGEILADLRRALPIDVAFLFMHGAQVAEGCDDVEGDLLSAVRELVGPQAVIGTVLDLHGNVTPAMVQSADLVLGCLEYPHTDYTLRTGLAHDLLMRTLAGALRPCTAAVRVPLTGIFPTTIEPTRALVERVRARQSQPGVLAISLFHGFMLADSEHTAASVVVTTDGDPEAASRIAAEVAADFLATARTVRLGLPMAAALDSALAGSEAPVVLADRADNPGGGAAGDSTYVLRELLRRGVRDAALALLWDPMAAEFAHLAGAGRRIALRLGGKTGPLSGEPLDAVVEVLSVRSDVRQAMFGQGEPTMPLGRSAALRVDGVDVIVASVRNQVFDPRVFSEHGVEPHSRRLLVVKSTSHFVNGFAPLAKRIVFGDGPGTVSMDLSQLPFTRLRRPIYPLDDVGLEITLLARHDRRVAHP